MTAVPNSLGDYLDDLDNASSAEDCMAATRHHIGKVGFRNIVFVYAKRPANVEGNLEPYLRYASVPQAWEDRYREMGYQNHCSVYREGLRGGTLPLIWQNIWQRDGLNTTQQQMLDEASSQGITYGFSVRQTPTTGRPC